MSAVLLPFLRGLPAMATSFTTPPVPLVFELAGVYTGVRQAGLVLERRSRNPEAGPGPGRGAGSDPDDVEVERRRHGGEPRVVGGEGERRLAVASPLQGGRQMDGVE